MKKSRFLSKILSHLVALLLGVGLTFGTVKVTSSQAGTLAVSNGVEPSTVTNQENIALKTGSKNSLQTHTSFVNNAIARTGSAVVRIDTEKTVASRVEPMFEDPFFREFFGDRFSFEAPQSRQIRGQGSGFITDKNGMILTNAHVVSQADKVTVTLKDGRVFVGEVTGTDEVTDLAVVKIDNQGEDLPIAPLGDSAELQVGDWAIAVGNPVGLNNTVTLGIISTLSRFIHNDSKI